MNKNILLFVCLLCLPSLVSAHHSHAEFVGEPVIIEGEITRVIWNNPHPAMLLKSRDASGTEQILRVQVLGNVNGMRRDGVTGEEFHLGQQVKFTGQYSERRQGLVLATAAEFEDGTTLVLGPYTSAKGAIYGSGNVASDIPDEPPSLFRVWTVLERDRTYDAPMTDAARAIKEAWDPILDDSQRDCSPLGMPGAMMSPHPIEFIDQGEAITLKLEEWDGLRTIYMTPTATGELSSPRMGRSFGRWEENTLVVHTSEIDYPYLDEYGTPQSSEVEITERFTLREDGRHLDWSATVFDPLTFTERFVLSTTTWHWLPGETLQPYDCEPLENLFDG